MLVFNLVFSPASIDTKHITIHLSVYCYYFQKPWQFEILVARSDIALVTGYLKENKKIIASDSETGQ